MKIHFNESLKQKALKLIHESKDLADVLNDLLRIDRMYDELNKARTNYYNIMTQNTYFDTLQNARALDSELRRKYTGINEMLAIANSMPPLPSLGGVATANTKCDEQIMLDQDIFGILYDTLKKKGEEEAVKSFVEYVEDN